MKVIVKGARLSFNDLFEAKSIGVNPKKKFSATLICLEPNEELGGRLAKGTMIQYTNKDGEKALKTYSTMQAVCEAVLKEKFGGKIPAKSKNWAFNKADGSTTREEYVDKEGNYWGGFDGETWYISASKQQDLCKQGKMQVLDQVREPIGPDIEGGATSSRLFSGCYVNAIVDVYAYETTENGMKVIGVTASLEAVQLVKVGEAFGMSHTDAAEDFEDEEFDEVDGLM